MLLKKIARITMYCLGVFLILILLGYLLLNNYFNKKISDQIHKAFEKGAYVDYRLDFDDPVLSIWDRSIHFRNVKMTPSGSITDSTKAMYGLVLNDLTLSGLSLADLYYRKDLNADDLYLSGLTVMVYQAASKRAKADTVSDTKEQSTDLKSLLFRSIKIEKFKIKVFKGLKDTTEVFTSEENEVSIKNFHSDSTIKASGKPFTSDVFDIHMKSLHYKIPDGHYTITGKEINLSYFDSVLVVDSVEMLPAFSKERFGEIIGYQVSRMNLRCARLEFSSLDAMAFIEGNGLISKKLTLKELAINVYRDKNIPFKKIVRPSVQQIIRGIPFDIKIDSVRVIDGRVVYEELAPDASHSGKVTFDHINSVIIGLDNDTAAYTEKSKMEWMSSAFFMNKARMDLACSFSLNTTKENFYCSGIMEPLPLNLLNNVLEPAAHISIEKGELDSLKFSFYASNAESNGELRMMYHALKVSLLNKEDNSEKFKQKVGSFLLDKFIIEESNPGKNRSVRTSKIKFERNPYRFLFYYIWKSVQSGIVTTIGLPVQPKPKA